MGITEDNKVIAGTALDAFGGKPSVSRYWDDNNSSAIDMLSASDRPDNGITSYSTLGLSDYTIGYTVNEKVLGTEIVGACATAIEFFPNILSSCAFNVINTKVSLTHGEILSDVISMYYPDSNMEHILLTSPFLWPSLTALDFPNKKVTWLLAVPLSTNELFFAKEKGTDVLEDLFEKHNINIFDLYRNSIV